MKLLFVHDHILYKNTKGDYYSAGGFPWFLWKRYLKHFDIITFVGRYGGQLNREKKLVKSSVDNVEFVFVEKIASPRGILKFRKVQREIESHICNSDAVVVRLPSENGLIAAGLAKKYNKPYAAEVVGCPWDALWNYGNLISRLYAPLLYLRMKRTVKHAPQVVYVTKSFLQKRYPHSKEALVVNASNVDVNDFDENILFKKIQQAHDFNPSEKVIKFGIIGNYKAKYKGLHIAIRALGSLKQKYSFNNFELHILGNGNPADYKKLIKKNECSENVKFDGPLPNGVPVLNWLDNLDFYLQPSLTEGLPRTVIEAMSRGLIIIGSRVGGIPELLNEEFLVKPGSIKELANKIWEVIHLPGERIESVAKVNFEKAKKYDSSLLENIRSNFYEQLKNRAKSNL